MTKMFYEWEDASDRYATGIPDLGRHPWARATTKRQVRKEWSEYMSEYLLAFPEKKPKIRVWKISYREVKL